MKKMLFIMNPYAGQRKANRFLPDIIAMFNRAGYEVTAHMTNGSGDATEVARRKAQEMDLIVCCGGDGTFSETASGVLLSGTDIPIGYIPAGTTNDFAVSMGLPGDILAAAQLIVDGEPEAIDMGRFGDRYFSYVASFGAFTRASYATPQNIKNALGHTAYILGGIQELNQIRKTHIRMELDDQTIEDDFLFGAISNSTSYAGIVSLDPKQVDMRDGKLEILLIRAPQNLTEITECIQAVQTQKYNCAMITFCRSRKMTVYADPDMPWTLDGEREEGHARIEVENQHLAIRVMQRKKT